MEGEPGVAPKYNNEAPKPSDDERDLGLGLGNAWDPLSHLG